MNTPGGSLHIEGSENAWRATIRGDWSLDTFSAAEAQLQAIGNLRGALLCDWSAAGSVDIGAAWLLLERLRRAGAAGLVITHTGNPPDHLQLLESFAAEAVAETPAEGPASVRHTLSRIGRRAVLVWLHFRGWLDFFGRIVAVLAAAFRRPQALRGNSVARHVYETGITAIPIVALIAFLISVIVAYLGAQQLTKFGADIFVVDLVTVAVLRELGVLLTSIIIAGRSGSAFAAEIGVMQINEETDALQAMGMNPVELLTVPRVLGLMIALPLLTVVADAMGLAGGGLLSLFHLNISGAQFVNRMREAISPSTFWVGIIKAPVFAFLIAMVGTYRGMQVRSSARELGRLTTMAVVQSIFLVILADAMFAIIFVKLGI
jgi:phospholipid/cholesterol/gamma-HCH transport system permease protein